MMEEFLLFTSDELQVAVLSSYSMVQFLEIVIRLPKTLQFCTHAHYSHNFKLDVRVSVHR